MPAPEVLAQGVRQFEALVAHGEKDDPRFRQVCDAICSFGLKNPLLQASVAGRLSLRSPCTLWRHVHRRLRMRWPSFIGRMRLTVASHLIYDRGVDPEVAADNAGFPDLTEANRVCVREFGVALASTRKTPSVPTP